MQNYTTNNTNYGYGSILPDDGLKDEVSGYTIRQIEDALYGQKHWNSLRDNIKSKYNNPTEKYIDELFNNWK